MEINFNSKKVIIFSKMGSTFPGLSCPHWRTFKQYMFLTSTDCRDKNERLISQALIFCYSSIFPDELEDKGNCENFSL